MSHVFLFLKTVYKPRADFTQDKNGATKALGLCYCGSGRGSTWAGFLPGAVAGFSYQLSGSRVMVTVDAGELAKLHEEELRSGSGSGSTVEDQAAIYTPGANMIAWFQELSLASFCNRF